MYEGQRKLRETMTVQGGKSEQQAPIVLWLGQVLGLMYSVRVT